MLLNYQNTFGKWNGVVAEVNVSYANVARSSSDCEQKSVMSDDREFVYIYV